MVQVGSLLPLKLLVSFIVILEQPRVTWEENTSIEELPGSYLPVGGVLMIIDVEGPSPQWVVTLLGRLPWIV